MVGQGLLGSLVHFSLTMPVPPTLFVLPGPQGEAKDLVSLSVSPAQTTCGLCPQGMA